VPTIQPAVPTVAATRASKPYPPTTSTTTTIASVPPGQPSPRTASVRASKPSALPTSATVTRASVSQAQPSPLTASTRALKPSPPTASAATIGLSRSMRSSTVTMKQARVHNSTAGMSKPFMQMPLVQPINGEGTSKQQELPSSSSKASQLPLQSPIMHHKSTLRPLINSGMCRL